MRRRWNKQECNLVYEYYGFVSTMHICKILGRSKKSVYKKATVMGAVNRKRESKDTLCWLCDKAGGKCNWSHDFTPVDGWVAMPTYIANDDQHSFIVKQCPEFTSNKNRY